MKIVKIANDQVQFINPIFPFIRSTKKFDEYTHGIIVEEYSSQINYDSLWLIKNNRLKNRISSFNYANYDELIAAVKTPIKGRKRIQSFRQIPYLIRVKVK